jgi:hypothetical protein
LPYGKRKMSINGVKICPESLKQYLCVFLGALERETEDRIE